MRKQGLLISCVILMAGSSALMLSRQADRNLGTFTLEGEKSVDKSHVSKAQSYVDAAKWRFDLLKDENGNFSPAYVTNALQQADHYRSVSRSNGLGLQWQELGPDDVGGRTRAILIDKRDTTNNTIYAGGVSGGMWKSTDGAATWKQIPGFNNWLGIACIAQAPAPDYSIYVGTGVGLDGNFGTSGASGRLGNGIFKLNAADSGVLITPDVMASGFFNPISTPWYEVNSLAVNPTNPNQIIAATALGLYKSTNGGATWTLALTGSLAAYNNQEGDAVKWSKDGKNIFASFYGALLYSNNGGTTWASENAANNNGYPSTPAGRIEVAIAPSNPNIIYALMSTNSNGECTKGIYKSVDGGHTWITIAVGGPLFQLLEEGGGNPCQGFYDMALAISPADPNAFYMGGISFYTGSISSGVQPASYGYSNAASPYYMHPDIHTIVIADNNPDLMYAGCDGGIFKSTDAYTNFPTPSYSAHNRGYNVTQNYGVAAGLDGSVIGGSQDNGTNYINYYGNSFGASQMVLGGDGFLNYVSQINPDFYFGAIYYAALYRSADHASSFGGYFDVKVDPQGQGGATVCGTQATSGDAQFCTPYYLSETKNALHGRKKVAFIAIDRTYLPGEVVAVTSDAGKYQFNVTLAETVQKDSSVLVDDPIRSRIFMSANCGVFLTSDALNIAIIPRWYQLTTGISGAAECFVGTPDGDNIYVATSQGYVYKFSNLNAHADTCTYPAGTSVGIIYPNPNAPDVQRAVVSSGRTIEGMDIDPGDPNHVVVVFAGFSSANQPHVYESRDGGRTWAADTAGLPNMPVYSVVVHSSNSIIVGTEFGIWSWDGSRWHEDDATIGRVAVYRMIERPLFQDGCNVLYVGSHGRGMWRSTTLTPASCRTQIGTAVNNVKPNAVTDLSVFPNPVRNSAKVSLTLDYSENVTIRVFDMTGRLHSEITYRNTQTGTNLFDLDASDLSSGTYVLAATVADTRTLSKLFVVTK